MRLAIIGAGAMGQAMGQACLNKGFSTTSELVYVQRGAEKAQKIRQATGSSVLESPGPEINSCRLVVLAVKPQDAHVLATQLSPYLSRETVILSIMAGISLATLAQWFPGQKSLVRSMPNLPARIGQGMAVFVASASLKPEELTIVEKFLGCSGQFLQLSDEKMIDAATAISGSGPGYFFFILESLIGAAQSLGFSHDDAVKLVQETMRGSLSLWEQSGLEPEALRAMVSSKGGTTAAACKVFEEMGLGAALKKGIEAAQKRAGELSGPK